MLTVDLFLLIENGKAEFVAGLYSSAPAELGPWTRRDTLRIAARRVERLQQPAAATFKEVPWDSIAMRASLGTLQTAPASGTFTLTIGAETTTPITFPEILPGATELSSAQIAAFKLAALNALKALPGVGSTGIVASDPAGTPATHLYFTLTDPEDERTISVDPADNALAPIVLPEVAVQRPAPGFQQLVKLTRAAIKSTVDFALAPVWSPTFVEQTAGASGTNAIQRLTIPEGVQGSLVVKTSGASSRAMALPGITASQLEAALNSIVIDGDTNPTFRVSSVGGKRAAFDVEFIGPAAETAQSLLTATFLPADPPTVATATLDLTDPRFTAALNGDTEVELAFEFVWTDGAGNEASLTKTITLLADLTQGGDIAQLDDLGAVITQTATQYVTDETASPFVEAAAGISTAPIAALAAGTALSITHNLATWRPWVRITRHIVNHTTFASDPSDVDAATTDTVPLGPGEFTWIATTENVLEIRFATALVADTSSAWDWRLIKVDIVSPTAIVTLFTHTHAIADVVGLQAILDGLAAALGMLGGSLSVPAANITNLIGGNQIDIASLITQIAQQFATNSSVQSALTSILQSAIIENSAFLIDLAKALLELFTSNAELRALFLTQIFNALGSIAADGVVAGISAIPSFSLSLPQPTLVDGPPAYVDQVISEEETVTTGGTTTKTTRTRTESVAVASKVAIYAPLSRALTTLTDGGTKTDITLELADLTAGEFYTVSGDNVAAAAIEGRPRVVFTDGDLITLDAGHIFKIINIAGVYYPHEAERTLFTVSQNSSRFTVGSAWKINFAPGLVLKSATGTAIGRITLIVEAAAFTPTAAAPHLASIAWTELGTLDLALTNVPETIPCHVSLSRTGESTFSGTLKLGNLSTDFTPAAADLAIRARVSKFDLVDDADIYGSLQITMNNATASLVAL